MPTNPQTSRNLFLTYAATLVAVAVLLAVFVIPPVNSDTYAGAAPERAAMAFWANVITVLAMAAVIFLAGPPLLKRGRPARSPLVLVGLIVFFAGFCLVDATAAFGSHGPRMNTARVFMGLGAALELLVGVLVIWTAMRRVRTN